MNKLEPLFKLPKHNSQSVVETFIDPFELRELKKRGMGSGGIYEIAVYRMNEHLRWIFASYD